MRIAAQAASRNNRANQRGSGLPRFSNPPRRRGATKAAHCWRRRRATTTAASSQKREQHEQDKPGGLGEFHRIRAMVVD